MASLTDDEQPSRGAALSRRVGQRIFDDQSSHLDRFGSLLVMTIVSVALLSLVDVDSVSNEAARGVLSIILSLTTGVTLVLALRASGVTARWRRVAEVSVVLAFVLSVGMLAVEQAADADVGVWETDRPSILWVVIALATPVAVVRRLIQHATVSASTMAGSIAAYLLIAIGFCYTFLYIDGGVAGGFFESARNVPTHDFMYFSLVSVTTVGYGDLTPGGPLAQLLATSEAVIGQVYLVTFVAMLVGLLIQQRDVDADAAPRADAATEGGTDPT